MMELLSNYADKEGKIIFEYDIPRLGKRVDVVLLLGGIIFCIEFKVGESKIYKTLNGFWEDSTRLPEFYEGTYQYLKSLGIEEI